MSNVIDQHAAFVRAGDVRTLKVVSVTAQMIYSLMAQAFPGQNILN